MGDPAGSRVSLLQGEEARFATPWGEGCVVVAGGCLREVRLPHETGEEGCGQGPSRLEQGPQGVGPGAKRRSDARRAEAWAAQLEAYFNGALQAFDLPLRPVGTAFQREVWSTLAEIPYGQTWSYGDVARRIGKPQAVRAVGAANGRNPIPIVLPCHRVIGADGSLTGFGGGLPAKQLLLTLEGALPGGDLFGAPA